MDLLSKKKKSERKVRDFYQQLILEPHLLRKLTNLKFKLKDATQMKRFNSIEVSFLLFIDQKMSFYTFRNIKEQFHCVLL